MMRVKNHHMPATIRVEMALGGLLVASSITLVLFLSVDLEKHPGYKGNSQHEATQLEHTFDSR